MIKNKDKYILPLVEKLPLSLKEYFSDLGYTLVSKETVENYSQIDYIIVSTEQSAAEAKMSYNTEKNDIEVFCIGSVNSIKNFLLNNGRLSIQEDILDSIVGKSILNKFLSQSGSIHLADNFPIIGSVGSFKVTNHLSFGSSSDQICLDAFDLGFNPISLKSYVDHVVYYLTYLRQAGIAGIPFEFEYGSSGDFFILNIHANIKNFVAEYMIDSFGSYNSKEPLKYLLNVVSRCCDFLDVTFVEDPGKLVFTSVWGKGESKSVAGFSFSNIKTAKQAVSYVERELKKINIQGDESQRLIEELKERPLPGNIIEMVVDSNSTDYVKQNKEEASKIMAFSIKAIVEGDPGKSFEDLDANSFKEILSDYPDQEVVRSLGARDIENLLDKAQSKNIRDAYKEEIERVKGGLEEDDKFRKELDKVFEEEIINRVSSKVDANVINKILGTKDEKELAQIISGQEQEDDYTQVISSLEENESKDIVHRITGNFENKTGLFDFSKMEVKGGESFEKDKKSFFRNLINTGIVDADLGGKKSQFLKSYLRSTAPQKMQKSFETFGQELGLSFEDLNEDHFNQFRAERMPKLLNEILEDGKMKSKKENLSPQFSSSFKASLIKKLDKIESVQKENDSYQISEQSFNEGQLEEVIKETMRETLNAEFDLKRLSENKSDDEKEAIVKTLSTSLSLEKNEMEAIVIKASSEVNKKETAAVIQSIFSERPDRNKESKENKLSSIAESALVGKVKKFEDENEKLKRSINALQVKLASVATANEKFKNISHEVQVDESQIQSDSTPSMSDDDRQEIVQKLKESGSFSKEDSEKLTKLIEREKNFSGKLKFLEIKSKRLELEQEKKNALFQKEIEKLEKTSSSKDLLLEKMKTGTKNIVSKYERENQSLNETLRILNKNSSTDERSKLTNTVKELEKENESISRMVDAYKLKLENVSKSSSSASKGSDSQKLIEENKQLKRGKVQLENMADITAKTMSNLELRCKKLKETEGRLRNAYTSAESKFKEINIQNKLLQKDKEQLEAQLLTLKSKGADDVGKLQTDLNRSRSQCQDLQEKLAESVKKLQKSAPDDRSSAKPVEISANSERLGRSVKKLNAELTKARADGAEKRKEVIKLKSEVNSLKNQNSQLSRDLQKAQSKKKKKAA